MSILSRIFKKVKQKSNKDKKKYKVVQQASFADLAGKTIQLEIRANGNNKLLSITTEENDNRIEIMVDQEKAILLSVLLQSYAAHEVFPDLDEE